tara:strand:- start:7566 stop:9005 length:1440 start_codon:yes stop_codon:yes gene_type:complete
MSESIYEQLKLILGHDLPTVGALAELATHRNTPTRAAEFLDESMAGIEITPEYKQALALVDAKAPAIFVTGRAGTGKSTFIQLLRARYEGVMAVVAPTGVAALNANGVTIHSFFRLPPRIVNPEDIEEVQDSRLYKTLRILVVDEVSMVRADLMDAMDQFLRLNGRDPNAPFGGVQLVLVGDLAQLPPVVSTEEEAALFSRRYKSPFFFSAETLAGSMLAPIELNRVFRQTDARFIELLSRIRLGDNCADVLDAINARADKPLPEPAPVVLTPTNAAADRINIKGLRQLPGELHEFVGTIEGKFKLEEKKLPAPYHLRLKEGARVMFTRNDTEDRWVNGTLGTVVEFSPGKIAVEIEERGRGVVDVIPTTWSQYRFRYDSIEERVRADTVGSYTQFALQLAWGITIHKAQGKTLPAVQVDLGHGAFAPGQTYVALSRARSLETIWLTRPLRREDIFCDKRIAAFYGGLFPRPRKRRPDR